MTLIEVLAGLAILATLLIAILVAKQRCQRQWARANMRVRAIADADTLMTAWWQNVSKFPRSGHGAVVGDGSLEWQTHIVNDPAIEELGGQKIQLAIFSQDDRNTPLAKIELVLPKSAETP